MKITIKTSLLLVVSVLFTSCDILLVKEEEQDKDPRVSIDTLYFTSFGYPVIDYPWLTHISENSEYGCDNVRDFMIWYEIEDFDTRYCKELDFPEKEIKLFYLMYTTMNSMQNTGGYHSLETESFLVKYWWYNSGYVYLNTSNYEYDKKQAENILRKCSYDHELWWEMCEEISIENLDEENQRLQQFYLISEEMKQEFNKYEVYVLNHVISY